MAHGDLLQQTMVSVITVVKRGEPNLNERKWDLRADGKIFSESLKGATALKWSDSDKRSI